MDRRGHGCQNHLNANPPPQPWLMVLYHLYFSVLCPLEGHRPLRESDESNGSVSLKKHIYNFM